MQTLLALILIGVGGDTLSKEDFKLVGSPPAIKKETAPRPAVTPAPLVPSYVPAPVIRYYTVPAAAPYCQPGGT